MLIIKWMTAICNKIIINKSKIAVEIICFLYILLLLYAAVNKLKEIADFKVQLMQSSILSHYVELISWGIPAIEIVIGVMLMFPKIRQYGLIAAYNLMIIFTCYIVFILAFERDIPCSCGGVIEQLGWAEHLVFNIVFVLIAAIGIHAMRYQEAGRLNY